MQIVTEYSYLLFYLININVKNTFHNQIITCLTSTKTYSAILYKSTFDFDNALPLTAISSKC